MYSLILVPALVLAVLSALPAAAAASPMCDTKILGVLADPKADSKDYVSAGYVLIVPNPKSTGARETATKTTIGVAAPNEKGEASASGTTGGGGQARSFICSSILTRFLLTNSPSIKTVEAWDALPIHEQAALLSKYTEAYRVLDELTKDIAPKALAVTEAAALLGLGGAGGKEAEENRDKYFSEVKPVYGTSYAQIRAAILSLYTAVAPDAAEGAPGPLVEAYMTSRDRLDAHLHAVRMLGEGPDPKRLQTRHLANLKLLKRMEKNIGKTHGEALLTTYQVLEGFRFYVHGGYPMKDNPRCVDDEGFSCNTVDKWIAALDGAERVAKGIAGQEADGSAKPTAAADSLKKAQEEAGALGAAAPLPPELKDLISPEEHAALQKHWHYEGLDKNPNELNAPLYTRTDTTAPIVPGKLPEMAKLHLYPEGKRSYCTFAGGCGSNNPFEFSDALSGGPTASKAPAPKPGAPKAAPPAPAAVPKPTVTSKPSKPIVPMKIKSGDLKALLQGGAKTLVLFSAKDCSNGTGGTFPYCPEVNLVFKELAAQYGTTDLKFIQMDIEEDQARWDYVRNHFVIEAPALVYAEGEVIKAIRGPHFPTITETRLNMQLFVKALRSNTYKGHLVPRSRSARAVEPPSPSASQGAQAAPAAKSRAGRRGIVVFRTQFCGPCETVKRAMKANPGVAAQWDVVYDGFQGEPSTGGYGYPHGWYYNAKGEPTQMIPVGGLFSIFGVR